MMRYLFIHLFLFHFMVLSAWAGDYLQCAVLNIGEGQAVLLQRGTHGILVDTGHFGKAEEVQRALHRYGITKIEAIVLTHLHPDHASGIFALMEHFPDATIYESGHRIAPDRLQDSVRWVMEKLDSDSWHVKNLRQGDRLEWHGVTLDVLWPKGLADEILNHQSLVISISYTSRHLLVMGDITKEQERLILEANLFPEKVDVLVVGHHGGDDATSEELLRRISPDYAVISTDADNIRGYPKHDVVERLKKYGAIVHLVSEQGDFVWRSEKQGEVKP